ncbi:Bgt-51515, partial [Blumeria graminis f. sp. tritici]
AKITANKLSISYSEKLFETINSNGSDLDVWAEVISLANDFHDGPSSESQCTPDIEIPIERRKYTTTTFTRNALKCANMIKHANRSHWPSKANQQTMYTKMGEFLGGLFREFKVVSNNKANLGELS